MLDQCLLKSHLYSTFVLPQTTEQNDMIHAIEVKVIHKVFIIQTIHKTDTALHLEIDSVMTRVLLLHNTLDHDLIITKEIRDPVALLTDPLIDMTLVTDKDHARIQEITIIHIFFQTTFTTKRLMKALNFLYIGENISLFIKASVQVQIKKYIITYTELMKDNLR